MMYQSQKTMKNKGIWLPIEIIRNKSLSNNEKLLLMEINQLSMLDKGCIASNSHFAELFQINKTAVSRLVNSLIKKGLIESIIKKGSRNTFRTIIIKKGTNKLLSRYKQNVNGVLTNCLETKENKTTNNTKSIIKKNISPENKFSEFIPLSLEFHKNQKKAGYHHLDFKSPITEKSKIVISGAETLDKINILDNEPIAEIKKVLDFILSDCFWSKQIISLSGLRAKKSNGNIKYFNVKNNMLPNNSNEIQDELVSLSDWGTN